MIAEKLYLGNTEIAKAYLGDNIVYEGAPEFNPNYIDGAVPMSLTRSDGSGSPYDDGWYFNTISDDIELTVVDSVLNIGDSYGFKSEYGQGFTALIYNKKVPVITWEDSIGFGIGDWGQIEKVNFATGFIVEDIGPAEIDVFYMIKRVSEHVFSLYKYDTPNSNRVLIDSIDMSGSGFDFLYPYFILWDASNKVRYPQFITS